MTSQLGPPNALGFFTSPSAAAGCAFADDGRWVRAAAAFDAVPAHTRSTTDWLNSSLAHFALALPDALRRAVGCADAAIEALPKGAGATFLRPLALLRKGVALTSLFEWRLARSTLEDARAAFIAAEGDVLDAELAALGGAGARQWDAAATSHLAFAISQALDAVAVGEAGGTPPVAVGSVTEDPGDALLDDFAVFERWVLTGEVGGGGDAIDEDDGFSSSDEISSGTSDEAHEAALLKARAQRGVSAFPYLHIKRTGPNDRGVHARCDFGTECVVLSVARERIITVERALRHPLCRTVALARIDADLSAYKHCYLALFILADAIDPTSRFAPYYATLPRSFPTIPLFWHPEELASQLAGSYLLEQVEERRRNIHTDYERLCAVAPQLRQLADLDAFMWARMLVASRNFGIVVDGVRTDALVPYADMLNHARPRATRWAYDSAARAFQIISLRHHAAGEPVFDSYGKKCNSRFLLSYGFTVAHNADDDTGQVHNELRIVVPLSPPLSLHDDAQLERVAGGQRASKGVDVWRSHRTLRMGASIPSTRTIRISTFYEGDATREAFSLLRFCFASGDAPPLSPGSATAPASLVGSTVSLGAAFTSTLPHPESDLSRCPSAPGTPWGSASGVGGGSKGGSGFYASHLDFIATPVPPLSCTNEAAVLGELARACAVVMRGYPSSYEEDVAELAALLAFTAPTERGAITDDAAAAAAAAALARRNRLNVLVLLIGEKAVAHFYARLDAEVRPLLLAPDARAALEVLERTWGPATPWGGVIDGATRSSAANSAGEERDIARYVRSVGLPLMVQRVRDERIPP